MYLVMGLMTQATISVLGKEVDLKLEIIDGMVGAMPVFENIEDAANYANGKLKIMEIKKVDNT